MDIQNESNKEKKIFQDKLLTHYDMLYEENRIKSFENSSDWPFQNIDSTINPKKMAEAGFYLISTKEDKYTRCFLCLRELTGWEEGDDPWKDHNRGTKCIFAKTRKSEKDLTVRQIIDFQRKGLINILKQTTEKIIETKKETFLAGENQLCSMFNINVQK